MKVYVTFTGDQVITVRGQVYDKDCIAELTLDVEDTFAKFDTTDASAEVHYLFGGCYEKIFLHNPPTDKHYSRGIIAAN